MFISLIYVDLPFHDCSMTFVMYVLDVLTARMGLRCKQIGLIPWLILILYSMDIVNRIISITIVVTIVYNIYHIKSKIKMK